MTKTRQSYKFEREKPALGANMRRMGEEFQYEGLSQRRAQTLLGDSFGDVLTAAVGE